ncbi:histone-lysine N-methyltransferase SETMAR-like [Octopus sinensis]|uniref:Histone-lysine N-methyltransferase SETMAR-like n=1 Tax=Octopus sinensis TaxID=2607531 RepID=A0A6P7SSZ0_9MOLL|nr:histone-lysine N-methyltransferase SETMAR-like [Octopus sinensis]
MLITEQYRVIFLYEYKLGHSAAEAQRNIKHVFGNDSVDIRTVQRWFQTFCSGNKSLKSEPRGRPKPVIRHYELNSLVKRNPRKTVRNIRSELKTPPSTASRHLKKIRKVKKMDRLVTHQFNEIKKSNKKNRRLTAYSMFLSRLEREPFLYRLITYDEQWILFDNSRRTEQWLDAGESRKHYLKPPLHPKKLMVTVWLSTKRVIHYSFLQKEKL